MCEALAARALQTRVESRRTVSNPVVPRCLTLGCDGIRAITVHESRLQAVHRAVHGIDVVAAILQLESGQAHLLGAELLRGNTALVGAASVFKERIDLCAVVALREETNPRKLSHDCSFSCVMERRIFSTASGVPKSAYSEETVVDSAAGGVAA